MFVMRGCTSSSTTIAVCFLPVSRTVSRLQLYPTADPEEVAAAVVEELKEDEWNLNELERLQQEQACFVSAARP